MIHSVSPCTGLAALSEGHEDSTIRTTHDRGKVSTYHVQSLSLRYLIIIFVCCYRSVSRFSESYIQSVGSQLTSDLEASLKEQCRLLSEADDRLSVSQTDAGRRCEREGQGRKAEAVRHSLSAKELWRKVQKWTT